MAKETLWIGDIPAYLRRKIYRDLHPSGACFLDRKANDQLPRPFGSGTYVRYGQHFGILTAAHVVRALKGLPWELALPKITRPLAVHQDEVEYACTPRRRDDDETKGPDIGFVRLLRASTITYLRGVVHFVNLEFHRSRVDAAKKLEAGDGFWCQVGFPAQYVANVRHESERILATRVRCVCYMGGMDNAAKRGRFDYYDGNVFYDGQRFMPETFEGMSGGALWCIRIRRKTKRRFEIKDRLLSGVVFCELANDDGRPTAIRSHGRTSIYNYALSKLISHR